MTTHSAQNIPLRFGNNVWHLPLENNASIRATLPPIDDLHSEVDRALSHPIDFASVDQMIVAGDVVALAVDSNVPAIGKVVSTVAQWLIEHGVPPQNLHVVFAGNELQAERLAAALRESGLAEVHFDRHDPDDTNGVSYLAADEEAQAIYLNRILVDADVVIPISCARSRDAIDYLGAFGIFPMFSNRETRGQLHCYARLSEPDKHQQLIDRADQAAWWLGLMVEIQVVPAVNDQVAEILCGLLSGVEEQAQLRLNQLSDEEPCDLVIACLDYPAQDWRQVAHALHSAARLCTPGGSIVLCTAIEEPIGPAMRRLRDGQGSADHIAKRLEKDSTEDALVAGAIFDTTKDKHVYLVSKHRHETVESLGMGVLEGEEQLVHIARQHPHYILIQSAQHS
jgi:nickel-dependent lactate racemase